MEAENAALTTRELLAGPNSLDASSPKGKHQSLRDTTSQGQSRHLCFGPHSILEGPQFYFLGPLPVAGRPPRMKVWANSTQHTKNGL